MMFIVKTKVTMTYEIAVEAKDKTEAQQFTDSLTIDHIMDYGHPYVFKGPDETEVHEANEDEKRLVKHPVYLEDGEIC